MMQSSAAAQPDGFSLTHHFTSMADFNSQQLLGQIVSVNLLNFQKMLFVKNY